jgi:hypothetical protein
MRVVLCLVLLYENTKCCGNRQQKNNIRHKYLKLYVENSAEICQFITNVHIFVHLSLSPFYLTHTDNVRCKHNFIRDVTSYRYISVLFPTYKHKIWMFPFCSFGRQFHLFPGLSSGYKITMSVTLLSKSPCCYSCHESGCSDRRVTASAP